MGIPIITWYDESFTENTSPEEPDENVTSPNPNSWRIADAENPNDSINHFVRRLEKKYFASTLREFTCAISVSVQHYPPYYPKNSNYVEYYNSYIKLFMFSNVNIFNFTFRFMLAIKDWYVALFRVQPSLTPHVLLLPLPELIWSWTETS